MSSSDRVAREHTGLMVMVVDDDPAIVGVLTEYLGHRGYEVIGCADGTEALQWSFRLGSALGVVIMDVMVGEDVGPAIVEAMTSTNNNLRVIYLSGHTRDDVMYESELKLPVAILQKPCELPRIASAVQRLMVMP